MKKLFTTVLLSVTLLLTSCATFNKNSDTQREQKIQQEVNKRLNKEVNKRVQEILSRVKKGQARLGTCRLFAVGIPFEFQMVTKSQCMAIRQAVPFVINTIKQRGAEIIKKRKQQKAPRVKPTPSSPSINDGAQDRVVSIELDEKTL